MRSQKALIIGLIGIVAVMFSVGTISANSATLSTVDGIANSGYRDYMGYVEDGVLYDHHLAIPVLKPGSFITDGLIFEGDPELGRGATISNATLWVHIPFNKPLGTGDQIASITGYDVSLGNSGGLRDNVTYCWLCEHTLWTEFTQFPPRTTTIKDLNVTDWNTQGWRQVDVTDIIQELVNSFGYNKGNNLGLVIYGASGKYTEERWITSNVGSNMPYIEVDFTPYGLYDPDIPPTESDPCINYNGHVVCPIPSNATGILFGLILDQTTSPLRFLKTELDTFTGAVEYNTTTPNTVPFTGSVELMAQSGSYTYFPQLTGVTTTFDLYRINTTGSPEKLITIETGTQMTQIGLATDSTGLIHIVYSIGYAVKYITYNPVTNVSSTAHPVFSNPYNRYGSLDISVDSSDKIWVASHAGTNVSSVSKSQARTIKGSTFSSIWISGTALTTYPQIHHLINGTLLSEWLDFDDYRVYNYTGTDTTLSFTVQGNHHLSTGTVNVGQRDIIAGFNSSGHEKLVTIFNTYNGGYYEIGFEESDDLGATMSAEEKTTGLTGINYGVKACRDPESGLIYMYSARDAGTSMFFGYYQDHIDNRTELITYTGYPELIDTFYPQRILFSDSVSTNETQYISGNVTGTWEEIIEFLSDDPDPDDPTPPGWDDEGYFTRGKIRLYLLLIGFAFMFIPLYLYGMTKGAEQLEVFWIMLFMWAVGFALLKSIQYI